LKVLLQRVTRASVSVEGEVIGNIGRGLVALVGVAIGDTDKDVELLVNKTVNLRIFEDDQGKLNLSLLDVKGSLLVISQFTLMADTRRGRRPGFEQAAPPEYADSMIDRFVTVARGYGIGVATGRFRSHMLVEIHNDGPVTIMLDSHLQDKT